MLDLTNRRIIIPGEFNFHATGNLTLSSDQHVIIKSGQTAEYRAGYVHGIWLNPIQDELNQPILEQYNISKVENVCIKHS